MATITSSANLNPTSQVEVFIDAAQRDITLVTAGNLDATGVTLQALYSYLKRVWRIATFDINSTGANATVTLNLANTTDVLPGMAVTLKSGTGTIAAGTFVATVVSTTQITVNTAPSVALDATSVITFENHLIEYPFPLVAITPEQFEFSADWTPFNDTTRKLLRTAGWKELSSAGVIQKEFVGVISLGNIDGTQDGGGDKVYYAFRTSGSLTYDTAVDFTYAGPVNEAVETYDIAGADNTLKELALFIRQEAKTFDKSPTTAIGIVSGTVIGAQAFRFPLSETSDIDYTVSDAAILAADAGGEFYDLTPGAGPGISYYATDQTSTGFLTTDLTTPRDFGVIISAAAGDGIATNDTGSLTLQEIYSWVKYQLRTAIDIDDEGATDTAVQIGNTSDELLQFVGPELQTRLVQNADGATTPSGVALDNFASGDIGNLAFAYTGGAGALQRFPLVASGTISFNANLSEDTDAKYTMYYQYTQQHDVSDLVIASVSQTPGDPGTASFTSAGNNLPVVTIGDYVDVSGFLTELGNNGVWQVTAITSQTSDIDVVRLDDLTVANETVSTAGADDNNFRFNPVDSPDALIVLKADLTQIRGDVPQAAGGSSVTFDYGFTNDTSPDDANTEENRVTETNVPIAIRAVGLSKAQWVEAQGTIVSGNANTFGVIAPLERNFAV